MNNESIIQQSEALKPRLGSFQNTALIVGLVGIAATIYGYVAQPDHFFQSYLLAFIYWVSLSMGSLGVLMLHHLAGGRWGFAIRRFLEAGSRTLPLMFILLLPILFLGLHDLYHWSHTESLDEILLKKSAYLNEPFFIVRNLIYFAIWGLIAFYLNRWSLQQDGTRETHPTRKMQRLSGAGIVIYALTMTLAGVDWIMSLEPHWFSTIFSAIYIIGQILLTWAFMTLVAVPLSNKPPLNHLLTNERLRDLGTFMLGFVMLWAYTSFSQFIIIWAGNLPEEITWYMTRLKGGWLDLGYVLIALHFALPFVLLVSSRIKARIPILVCIAFGLMVMRLVDLFWITAPAFDQTGLSLHWLDIAIPIGMGGIWVAFFFWHLKRHSLIALNDPRFEDFLSQEDEHSHG